MNNILLQTTTATQSNTVSEITALLYLIVPILIGFTLLIVILAYRARKKPILQLFGSKYFSFAVLNPAGQLKWVHRTTSDFKVVGKVILWKMDDQNYKIIEDRLFWNDNIPCSLYKFGNPIPVNIYDNPDAEIAVYDKDEKTMVKVRMSAQELKGAIESKVVNELNKVGFNRIELITLIVMFAVIALNVVVLIQTYQINGEYNSLIQQLNQILSHLQSSTSTTPVP